ncbi:aminotransferase class V-fold PLP-dependent enzyme [Kribbella sp. VKM Ac-2569]|uniref:aminotransferase class V-fold PLP-dependent enzyme n=1 Tax=Kribbella sp. VKM Ac-2569 TaxID=2512220 RepID=UPI001F53F760|nr:aminotransferase class V-fold PLP-dependent enzyme [Kribbella sp. VKM Ac-2569]
MTVLRSRPDLWTLDPDVLHLNHGSYGAVPRRTQEVMAGLRAEMDANPMVWFRTVADRLTASRLALAAYLETDPDGFALVPNASAGVTVALQTLPIPAGSRIVLTDHAYGAVRFAAERFGKAHGAEVVIVEIPIEADDETVVALIADRLDGASVLIVDQITSGTAKVFPIDALVAAAHERGVPVVVDGAHAPALIDAPAAGGADFWTGNFHKWPAAPRATAGLVVAEQWRTASMPLIVSWSEYDERMPERFDMLGTYDYVPWIAAPESLGVLADLDWPTRRPQLTTLVEEGAKVLAKALGTGVAEVAHPPATMRLVELPSSFDLAGGPELKLCVSRELKAEITLTGFDDRGFIRLSAHAYNSIADYEKLSEGLPKVLA